MNSLDRLIQRLRFREAAKHIPVGARLLDVGSDDGSLFSYLGSRIAPSVGVDPNAPRRRWREATALSPASSMM